MAQIINAPRPHEVMAEKIGTGLSSGLQSLLSMKMQDMAKQKQAAGIKALGLPDEMAGLDPRIIQQVLQNKQQQSQMGAMNQILGLGQDSQSGGGLPQTPTGGPEAIGASQQPTQPTQGDEYKGIKTESAAKKLDSDIRKLRSAAAVAPKEYGRTLVRLADGLIRERSDAFSQTKDYRTKISGKAEKATERMHDLKELRRLVEKGKLVDPANFEFFKRAGLGAPATFGSDTQAFEKITQSFMRDIGDDLKGSISNVEIEAFMKTIPNLSQTDKGKMIVIAGLEKFYKASKERSNIVKKLIKKRGMPPLNIMEKVDSRMEKKMGEIYKDYMNDVERVSGMPEESWLGAAGIVGGQMAGSVLGAGGKALGGVGKVLGGGL